MPDEQDFQCECGGCHRGLENSGEACGHACDKHDVRCVFERQFLAYVVRKCGADLHGGAFAAGASAEELRNPGAYGCHRDGDQRKVRLLVESDGKNLVHAAFRPASPFLVGECDGCTAERKCGNEVQRVCIADCGESVADVAEAGGERADDGSEGDPEQDECRCGEPHFHFFPDTFFCHFHHLLLHFGAELIELLAGLAKITEFHRTSSLPKIVPKIAKRTEVSKITA